MGFIYGLECPIKNRIVYIGLTTRTLKERLYQHISSTKCKMSKSLRLNKKDCWIKNLMQLNEEKNIKIILLEECDVNLLVEKESFWILEYLKKWEMKNLLINSKLNIGYHLSEETKKKISDKIKGENHPNFGKHLSDETKNKISKSNSGSNNGMFGVHIIKTPDQIEKARVNMINSKKFQDSRKSKEYKEKISDIFSIPVILLNEKFEIIMEFKNTTKCAEYFGYTRGNIKNAVRDLRQIGKGRKEKYWVVRKENMDESIKIIKEK